MQPMRSRKFTLRRAAVRLALLAALLLLAACGRQQAAQPEAGDVVTAFVGDLAASATAGGQVEAARQVDLTVSTPGFVAEVPVRVGDAVQAGDLLVQLDTATLALNVATAEQNLRLSQNRLAQLQTAAAAADVAAAEAGVASAQASLDDLLAGPTELQRAVYEANLRAAEASVWSASADLNAQQDAVSSADVEAAEAALLAAQLNLERAEETDADNPTQQTYNAVQSARQAVAAAQARLDALTAAPDVAAAQSSVAAAAARYDASEADVALQTAAATEAERASAEAQLAQAQAQLASLLADPAAEDVAAAEAEIAQAELALADAEQALAEAAITAPFAGVVTAVSVSPGEYAAGVVVSLIDAGRLEVVLAVDETDVGSLEVGQPAALTLETWPDVEIPASVAAIAPQASSAADSALVTYDVHLRLGDTDLPVRAGMTANASLITAQRTDVLLVPNQAISADRGSGTYSVNRVDGDTVTAVPVTIGLRDSQYTQITSGIAEGDQLLIGDTLPLQQFGPNSE